MKMKARRTTNRRIISRRGVAAVEFAVCLPLLIAVVLGSIEISNTVYMRHASTVVAYETAQVASAYGGTRQAAELRGSQIMTAYGIDGGTITISPPVNANTAPLTEITVTVTLPADTNSAGISIISKGQSITSTVTMMRL